MSDRDQDIGAALDRQGWRQGSILAAGALLDLADALPSSTTAAVVISQDCDIVRDQRVEPHIELLCGGVVAAPDNHYVHSRHPRTIHLTCIDGSTHVEFDIRLRAIIDKHRLVNHGPDPTRRLSGNDVRSLAAWVAKRYTRPAFPDALNERLRAVDERLDKLVKHNCSRPVTGVYLMLEDFEAELPPDKPYEVSIWFSCRPESLIDEGTRRQVYEFARRYVEILSACPGMSVVLDEVRGEDQITISEIAEFRRLDYDSRSLAAKPGGDLPPAGR